MAAHETLRLKTLTPSLEAQSRRLSISSDDDVLAANGEEDRLLGGERIRKRLYSLPKPLLALLSVLAIFIIYSLTTLLFRERPHFPLPALLSNGTHPFYPTVILISLDGFRPSYLSTHPHLLPNLLSLPLRAESIQPVFPTLTFPNHWSLMTGLYPESHGIVANNFWDVETEQEWAVGNEVFEESMWWGGMPIWEVVERSGRISGNIMWWVMSFSSVEGHTDPIWRRPGPGTSRSGVSLSHFMPFANVDPPTKLAQLLQWIDLDINDRPQFISAYIPEVDQKGHLGGPVSSEVEKALTTVDTFVGGVLEGIKARNLGEVVEVIVVSDHGEPFEVDNDVRPTDGIQGMASTANERLIYLDDILGKDGVEAVEHKDGWPCVGLRFKEGTDISLYYHRLLEASKSANETFAVYTHETMPERWHFSHSDRIAPIYIIPHLGWALTDHHEHEVLHEGDYRPKGNHGYDNTFAEMQGIFLAQGTFVDKLKAKANIPRAKREDILVLESFANLEIFGLVMKLMGLDKVAPTHNGTVGFWDQLF
ncbi:hypothetical protein P7C73_g5211, partial [Tremellales sp. Uapishka_1]